jgi:hypothetical protein
MRRLHPALIALLALCGVIVRTAEAQDSGKVVALPPFLVEENGQGPPWRYAELPGFEVLSRCPDASTRTVVQAYVQLHQLLGVILPPDLRLQTSEPLVVILCPEEMQNSAAKEIVAQMMKTADAKRPSIDSTDFGGRGFRGFAPPRVSFMPNLRLSDSDAVYVFTIVRDEGLNTDTLFLTVDYIAFMLRNRVPTLPAWFVTGFIATYREMSIRDGEISLKPLSWPLPRPAPVAKKDGEPPLPPPPPPVRLEEFFRGESLRHDPTNPQLLQAWTAQAALFVRWGLDDRHPERRPALWKFLARASQSSASEKLFTECFGFDYAAAQAQLAEFLPAAEGRTVHYQLDRSVKPPPVRLHDAAPAEIARLKGDWERLEVRYVKENFPDVASKYLEQSRRTLARGYEQDPRNPRLLATLGLWARDAGDDNAARDYLEAATRIGGPLRPRAWLELARLRLTEALAAPAGTGGKLSANQTVTVFTPLFTARPLQPALVDTYRLIARAWAHCESLPTRAHLAVLDEGVVLFPRDAELVHQTAELYLARGWLPEARNYIELGSAAATDDATRARFALLLSRVPAAAP